MSNDALYIDQFFNVMGEGEIYRPLSPQAEARIAEVMPAAFVRLLQRNGFCSFQDQMLWICDPQDWSMAVNAWMPDIPNAQVFARTSFGDLFVWAENRCWLILAQEALISEKLSDLGAFLAFGITDADLWKGSELERNTKAAKEQLGPLDFKSIYSWIPALGLGGSEESSKLEIAPAVEHLMILSAIQQPQLLRY